MEKMSFSLLPIGTSKTPENSSKIVFLLQGVEGLGRPLRTLFYGSEDKDTPPPNILGHGRQEGRLQHSEVSLLPMLARDHLPYSVLVSSPSPSFQPLLPRCPAAPGKHLASVSFWHTCSYCTPFSLYPLSYLFPFLVHTVK